ncbi:Ribosomal protein S18 acetylase RimI [Pedobacter steynii]|uniref:Ribosomal protein S18 acetylase RimI n=1 Tax=Pedobacter steynii TaxID=430522 RepID=A0A1G9TZX2_9SPHI|nr:GNAT family N-acetyltransferase [Pedobacter steynii]NQX40617.1 GNAT family N-acetyltransferase [Pedobacter steynii]SDM53350.1 Ribosomal protein S18 acetylase RimI [Pedobacter steynii]
MTIKPITTTDLEICATAYLQTYNQAPWNYQWKYEDALKYLEEYFSSPQFKGFVLFDNDTFAGAIFTHTKTWWTGSQLYIDELFIAPQLQKKGYGKMLMNHAEEYALEQGLSTVTLMTHQFMPAMKFYQDIDFMHAPPFVILFKLVDGHKK